MEKQSSLDTMSAPLSHGATIGDAAIYFMQGFERNPIGYILVLGLLLCLVMAAARVLIYIWPRDMSKMLQTFTDGMRISKERRQDELPFRESDNGPH
jgi:hypothetical protein